MAVNIIGGRKNLVFAKQNIAIADTPLNASNIIVILSYGDVVRSHNPLKNINGFDSFVAMQGYVISAKIDMELPDLFYTPPFTSGNAITWEDGNPITPE